VAAGGEAAKIRTQNINLKQRRGTRKQWKINNSCTSVRELLKLARVHAELSFSCYWCSTVQVFPAAAVAAFAGLDRSLQAAG